MLYYYSTHYNTYCILYSIVVKRKSIGTSQQSSRCQCIFALLCFLSVWCFFGRLYDGIHFPYPYFKSSYVSPKDYILLLKRQKASLPLYVEKLTCPCVPKNVCLADKVLMDLTFDAPCRSLRHVRSSVQYTNS